MKGFFMAFPNDTTLDTCHISFEIRDMQSRRESSPLGITLKDLCTETLKGNGYDLK